MKLSAVAVVILAAASLTVPPALADADGHVNFFLGQKSLDSDDWAPIDDQFEFGAVMSFGQESWPVHIAVDVLGSVGQEDVYDDLLGSVTLTGSTFEVDTGVRKIWKKGKTLPYIGAGVSVIGAALELDNGFSSVDANGGGFGFWAGGGVFWRLGTRFNIGLDLRYSAAEVDLDFGSGVVAHDVSAGGLQLGLLLGFGW
jgi:hypothetical protein